MADQLNNSQAYYGESSEALHVRFASGEADFDNNSRFVWKQKQTHSKRIPSMVWYLIAKSLGLKLSRGDKPILGTFLFALTLLFSMGFGITSAFYIVYDIKATNTRLNILMGLAKIAICFYWCSLGVYGNQLAGRLFYSPKVVDSIRLHSKTICKMSSAFLLLLLALLLIGLNIYKTLETGPLSITIFCDHVNLHSLVCILRFVFKVGYWIFVMLWNLLVGVVLLSVCRTHTIAIRRFLLELEADYRVYQSLSDHPIPLLSFPRNPQQAVEEQDQNGYFNFTSAAEAEQLEFSPRHFSSQRPLVTMETEAENNNAAENTANNNEERHGKSSILTNDQILISFWKINVRRYFPFTLFHLRIFQNRLKETSLLLQRWLLSWVLFVILWSGAYVIYWLRHEATLLDIAEFVIPILILPIICSAYGEVNHEGRRVLKSVCPTESRVHMLVYLQQQPLELTAFGFPVDYLTITKVVGALTLAFVTKIVIDEVNL